MRRIGTCWLIAVLALLAAFAATPAAAQTHVWPGAEEQTGLGLHYNYSEVPTYLLDEEENDVDVPFGDRTRHQTRTSIGATLLASDTWVNGFFAPSFTWFKSQRGAVTDWCATMAMGMSWNFYRIEIGESPGGDDAWTEEQGMAGNGGDESADDDALPGGATPADAASTSKGRKRYGIPNIYFGLGFQLHAFVGSRATSGSDNKVDTFGGELCALMFVGSEIVEHLNVWIFPTLTYGYQNDDGDESDTNRIDRIYEIDNVFGFGFGVSYRFDSFLLMFEGHFISTTSFTVTMAYLF